MDEIGIGLLDFGDEGLKVPRKPQIVVAEIGDVFSACALQAFVVGAALSAKPLGEIGPVESRILESSNHLLAVVGTAVSDHPNLKISEGLIADGGKGALECVAAIVGCDDYGNFWHGLSPIENAKK